jgi:hypothetical protein
MQATEFIEESVGSEVWRKPKGTPDWSMLLIFVFARKGENVSENRFGKYRKKIQAKPAHPRVRRSFRFRSKRGICEQNLLR